MSAFYLKYRPQSLGDLIGQEIPKKVLLSAFENNKLFHAYLFVGPRGTGKTSTARILAKMVNCTDKNAPCNKCAVCISITDGSNLDLIEIDAASNRGIEDIRALREKIKLSPSSSKKKIYIIDEVHMLTTEAFNALLKTLEEPPAHALFIMATTDASKLPQTIISRVQRLDFKLANTLELSDALQKIIKSEKIDIDEESLKVLIKKSEGSFRDGVKLLDQVASLGGKITKETLEKNLKSSNFDEILNLLTSLYKKDPKASLSWINKQSEVGVEAKDIILNLMDSFRSLVFIKNGLGQEIVEPNMMVEQYQSLIQVSENFTNSDLIKSLDSLQKALEKLKTTSIPSLPLEVAVVEMTQSVILSPKDEGSLANASTPETSGTPVLWTSEILRVAARPASGGQNEEKEPESVLADQSIGVVTETVTSDDIALLKDKWTFVLETIRPYNFSLEALLRSINVTECTESAVILEVPYSFHQRILEAPKNRDLLESIFSDVLGRSIRITTVLGNRPSRKEDIVNIEIAQDDEIIRAAAEIFNSDSFN